MGCSSKKLDFLTKKKNNNNNNEKSLLHLNETLHFVLDSPETGVALCKNMWLAWTLLLSRTFKMKSTQKN